MREGHARVIRELLTAFTFKSVIIGAYLIAIRRIGSTFAVPDLYMNGGARGHDDAPVITPTYTPSEVYVRNATGFNARGI